MTLKIVELSAALNHQFSHLSPRTSANIESINHQVVSPICGFAITKNRFLLFALVISYSFRASPLNMNRHDCSRIFQLPNGVSPTKAYRTKKEANSSLCHCAIWRIGWISFGNYGIQRIVCLTMRSGCFERCQSFIVCNFSFTDSRRYWFFWKCKLTFFPIPAISYKLIELPWDRHMWSFCCLSDAIDADSLACDPSSNALEFRFCSSIREIYRYE